MLTLVVRLDAVALSIDSDYNQAFIAGTPEMRATLTHQRQGLKASLEGFQALLQGIAAGESRLTQAQLAVQQAQVLSALRDAWGVGLVDLERLLKQRRRIGLRQILGPGAGMAVIG